MSKELEQKRHFYFLAGLCFLFSLSLHLYFLFFPKFYNLSTKSEPVPPLILELDVVQQKIKTRQSTVKPDGEGEVSKKTSKDYQPARQTNKLQKTKAIAKLSLSNARVRAHLKQIKAMILAYWDHATPPGLGHALVLIRLNAQGQIMYSEIESIYGSRKFVRFVRLFLEDLTKLKFPRLDGMDDFWLECEFRVEPD
ncbi:hypothetical protein KFV02_07155 [Desulfohalobiaceae bacterium Ax17]|uniref:hypothetical protein n=1 Tax=Desulfovulcanus ferrireducens TaxID=2831190 RepID=UPI00207BB628|nr:hypothetical protein [Desulfovulcanus ferrireducens]MBT8763709.1 hypothetical protein [Desulfovulcanus ferrireducens]